MEVVNMGIKLLVLDVDGTLTDGGIYISSDGVEIKKFQAKDGLILRKLPEIGIQTMILTGRESRLTQMRAEDLHISYVVQGVDDKVAVLKKFIAEHKLEFEDIAYVGDDLNDYTAMNLCGFKACPADSAQEIRELCDYVSPCNGGYGTVRDVCEQLLKRENLYNDFLRVFGKAAGYMTLFR
jgi:3-deoxy-D-manno-octulosonate 8-phosphate phosphatase (KDO 8-P phosphatase)